MQEDKKVKKKGLLGSWKVEKKKVIWPTKKQTINSTLVTIMFVLMISIVLIILNFAFNWLSTTWINHLPGGETIINSNISGETNRDILETASGEESSLLSGENVSGEVVSGE